jgi:hypothetical protein
MILRLLNPQGFAGIAASLILAVLLVMQKVETSHWKKQSSQFEQLYRGEQATFAGTVANYRAAAEAARAADLASAQRVHAEQARINERTAYDYEARLADARARAQRLRLQPQSAAADSGGPGGPPVPGLSAAPGGAAQAAGEDGLSASLVDDDALTATEQAIQLDELIKWVRRQATVDIGGGVAPSQRR